MRSSAHLKSFMTRSAAAWLSAAGAAPVLMDSGAAGTGMPAARRASVGSCAEETCEPKTRQFQSEADMRCERGTKRQGMQMNRSSGEEWRNSECVPYEASRALRREIRHTGTPVQPGGG